VGGANRPDASIVDVATCWLIGNRPAAQRSSAARFARLRGIETRQCDGVDSLPGQVRTPTMIAICGSRLQGSSVDGKQQLANMVAQGAVLHVYGVPAMGADLDLAPFAQSRATIGPERGVNGLRFTASPLLPAVLAGEETDGLDFQAPGAVFLPPQAEELLMLRHVDGGEHAAIFALRHGAGHVIYDLHVDGEDGGETPLVERLACPESRYQDVGALLAADCTIHRDRGRRPAFDLIIDDRPVNLDHFNTVAVNALLNHIEEVCPGAHTDFAWTPRHTSPCRGYLEVMKRFSTGFVWHGFYRHIDHSLITDPAAELATGTRLVAEIEQRYGVRLQPIMIFPFERSTAEQFQLLRQAGFLACVQEPGRVLDFTLDMPRYLQDSLPCAADPRYGVTVLHRYNAGAISEDQMLAMAMLGLPILAYAHPEDLGLRRFSRVWDRKGDMTHFDRVLKFALSKGLPARSLEEIATEANAAAAEDAP
jgi:hypothetical protein